MKKLSKFIAAVMFIAAVFQANQVNAQTIPVNTFKVDIGVESGITTGAINYTSKTYVGLTARLQYGLSQNFALTLTAGYYDFLARRSFSSMGMIPVKVGFKYFAGQHFYFSGEAGAGFELSDFGAYKNGSYGIPKSTKLIWSPGVGYAVKSWDFGLRYENFSSSKTFAGEKNNYGTVSLRVAHSFGL